MTVEICSILRLCCATLISKLISKLKHNNKKKNEHSNYNYRLSSLNYKRNKRKSEGGEGGWNITKPQEKIMIISVWVSFVNPFIREFEKSQNCHGEALHPQIQIPSVLPKWEL